MIKRTTSFLRAAVGGLTLLLAVGCATVGPDYEPPTPEVPAAWQTLPEDTLDAVAVDEFFDEQEAFVLLDDRRDRQFERVVHGSCSMVS